MTRRSISRARVITAEDRLRRESRETRARGERTPPQTESRRPLRQVGKDHVMQSSLEQGNSFFSLRHTGPPRKKKKNSRWIPPPSTAMVFWFQFPISSLSQFDKVTSRCHLQYPTPFTQAPWNAIINMKYCPDRLQLFQRGKHQCLLFRNQALAPGASHYLSSLGGKKKNLQQGLPIPRLFVVLLWFSKTRLSQSPLTIWTSRWNDKRQEIFILLDKLPNPFP